MKKAEANMWWVIIGAVLAIVVMVVLLVMFGEGTKKVSAGLSECESKLGKCVEKDTCVKDHKGTVTTVFECKENKECCFGAKGQPA